jgi:hypothetical protein
MRRPESLIMHLTCVVGIVLGYSCWFRPILCLGIAAFISHGELTRTTYFR